MRRLQDLFPCGGRSACPDIFQKGVLEQFGVLEYKGNHLHQVSMRDFSNVHTADLDCPLLHIVETGDQAGRCAFAGAGMPDQCGSCSGLSCKAQMGYRRMIRIFVCEGHILKGDIVSLWMFWYRSLHLRFGTQDHVDAAHGLLSLHLVAGHIHDLVKHNCTGRRENHIEQKTLHKANQVVGNEPDHKRRRHQHQEAGIDDCVKRHHSLFAGHRVIQSKLPVGFDGVVKLGDRLHCLSEHLDYRNTPDVLHRLMVHRFQRVLVGLHEFHAVLPHEGSLQEETDAKE